MTPAAQGKNKVILDCCPLTLSLARARWMPMLGSLFALEPQAAGVVLRCLPAEDRAVELSTSVPLDSSQTEHATHFKTDSKCSSIDSLRICNVSARTVSTSCRSPR